MYITHYLRKDLKTEEVTTVAFSENDAWAAGVPYARLAGIPQLEAMRLVNGWNITQLPQRFVFGIEA